jgi:hypothetical protein
MLKLAGLIAIAYLRWSKFEQTASLVQQKEVLSRWSRKHGVTIVDWIVDDGISGTLREDRRPGFGEFVKQVETRPDVNLGVCFDLSRFGRFQDPNVYGYYFTKAKDVGKFFYFPYFCGGIRCFTTRTRRFACTRSTASAHCYWGRCSTAR